MLQFLANVDPVSLPMWAVLLLSFAMYPLGFLFGACSDCCDECPEECSKCARAYSGTAGDGPCSDIDTGNTSIQITGGTSQSGTVTNRRTSTQLESYVDLPFSCKKNDQTGVLTYTFTLRAYLIGNWRYEQDSVNDNCGCRSCCSNLFRAYVRLFGKTGLPFNYGNFASEPVFFNPTITLCECSEDSGTVVIQLNAITDFASFSELFLDDCQDKFNDWLSGIQFTFTFSGVPTCECGACCEADGSCEVTPEFYCDATNRRVWYDFGGPEVEWQGVGTTCDPNPCPQPGACCDGGECSQTLEENCGGVFQGEGTTCDPSPC